MNFTNASSSHGIQLHHETVLRSIVFITVSSCLCLVTCSLTILLMVVIIRQKSLFSGAKMLILHQLVVELQMTVIHWPVHIIAYAVSQNDYYFSTTFCRHYLIAYMTTMTAGLWGLLILACHRLLAIASPYNFSHWDRLSINVVLIITPWFIGFFDYLYFYLGGDGGFGPMAPFGICTFLQRGVSFAIANTFSTYLPLGLAGLMYILLFLKAVAINRKRQIWNSSGSLSAELVQNFRRRIRLARLLFAMTVIHTLCFASIPLLQSFFMAAYKSDPMTQLWVRQFFCLGYLSTPVMFFALNKECWEGAKRIFLQQPPLTPTDTSVKKV
ncbi:proteinase-activated receptor 1-like [Paramacrobiotus metropolitanus]|uniref:proteinase-activated receptor 1-like n=1 Tax=Paramacrobiotus metropolitanus TaxID=2943436 RepID=UPI00244579B3|nr:proteinase-activated receptor 1-like [Paramacrobiotus metropolitanus]XP_055342000.1 proteinase-activated receptor 1-like [Paramacrobiotus metropolitanus]XP_055342001.1 proteinase-activated receptor 1-like [Paramacrobiotus metropolitanus]XP_055342003.1 proteinase-activated receptor 1-like [Paramacrobiotus metropolitanus]